MDIRNSSETHVIDRWCKQDEVPDYIRFFHTVASLGGEDKRRGNAFGFHVNSRIDHYPALVDVKYIMMVYANEKRDI